MLELTDVTGNARLAGAEASPLRSLDPSLEGLQDFKDMFCNRKVSGTSVLCSLGSADRRPDSPMIFGTNPSANKTVRSRALGTPMNGFAHMLEQLSSLQDCRAQ